MKGSVSEAVRRDTEAMPVLGSTNQNGEGSIRALCLDADPPREAMDPAMAADRQGPRL